MRLHSAHITNFKLLEDVELIFSSDPARPLTVVRAENGSGKTSILQALRWCIWGERGISQRMSLTSASGAAGKPVTVQVWIEFSERDRYSGAETTYRLIRTCQETRAEGDRFERGSERSRLLRLTDQGDSEIRDGHDAIISAMLPRKLADVFFTDGDVVQNFVTDQTERDRQEYVHEAIRHLLGFDEVELAEQRLRTISRSFRQKVSESGSEALRNAEIDLEKAEEDLESKKKDRTHLLQRINEVEQQIREDERELSAIKGIGDLEAIQAQINQIGKDIKELDDHEDDIRQQMKDLLQSEDLSNCLLRRHLEAGAAALAELEDRNVIPGMSVGLLHDRLELGVCICGARLNDGDRQHAHILDLIERQRQTEPRIQRLTALRHEARSIGIGSSLPLSGGTVTSLRERVEALRTQYTQCKDRQRQKEGDLRALRERREQIDANRVRQLTERLRSSRLKKSDFDRSRGHIEGQISALEDQVRVCTERVRDARRREQLSHTLTRRSHVADDLLALTAGILNRLKTHYVHRVSERMNQLFLEIVGADLTADANLFSGVDIDAHSYDVVVHAQGGRTLDVVTELSGAQKRALALSLIWALMEVAEKEAPRIIDTPLGMTSDALKRRMVDLITYPADVDGLPYQVILFMTRSEITDIEHLLQGRAGAITTLSCSKDYPIDLVNDWGVDYPVVQTCGCDHTQICALCERHNDRGRFTYREVAT